MTTPQPIVTLDERFSSDQATARPWADVLEVIEQAEMFWLSTVRADGRPHVTPLPAMWLDGALHFATGPNEQKAKNIQRNPACALTTGTNQFRAGLDVVVEGVAVRVTDRTTLVRLAAMWQARLDWPFEATNDGFQDKSTQLAGQEFGAQATAQVFGVTPAKVLAFGKGEPFSQTRYKMA